MMTEKQTLKFYVLQLNFESSIHIGIVSLGSLTLKDCKYQIDVENFLIY